MVTPREGYVSLEPWEGYMEPFKIFGNLYFVGNRYASSHIIDTGDGLILLDSNYPQCLYLVLEGIRNVGLNPADIKYIIHSHGHYDHIGGTKALIELYGCKTIIGREDKDYVNGKLDLTWAKELGFEYFEAFEPDVLLDDGDVFELGNTKIRAVSTPGHSPGNMSFFFNVTDGEKTYTAAMFGGAGVKPMTMRFLNSYGLPLSYRDDFAESLKKVWDEKVDISIGNHQGDVDTLGKYAKMKSGEGNPFVDASEWKKQLAFFKKRYEEMIESGE